MCMCADMLLHSYSGRSLCTSRMWIYVRVWESEKVRVNTCKYSVCVFSDIVMNLLCMIFAHCFTLWLWTHNHTLCVFECLCVCSCLRIKGVLTSLLPLQFLWIANKSCYRVCVCSCKSACVFVCVTAQKVGLVSIIMLVQPRSTIVCDIVSVCNLLPDQS